MVKYTPPHRLPEANIQARLWRELDKNNIPCILEYKIKGVGRIDIAILNKEYTEVIGIVEVKSYSINKPPNYFTKQIKKYSTTLLPVLICGRIEQIEETVDRVKTLY